MVLELSIKFDEETKNALLEANKSDKLANAFIEKEVGIPNFSQIYPIFAQTSMRVLML